MLADKEECENSAQPHQRNRGKEMHENFAQEWMRFLQFLDELSLVFCFHFRHLDAEKIVVHLLQDRRSLLPVRSYRTRKSCAP